MAIASSSPSPSPGGGDLQALQQLLAAGGDASGGGQVYMGAGRATPTARDEKYGMAPRKSDLWMSKKQAEQDFFHWSKKKQGDFISQAILAGRLPLGAGLEEGAADWKKLVNLAGQFGAAGQKVTPWDILATYVSASGGGNSWTQQGVWEVNTVTGEHRYKGPGKYLGNGAAMQTDTRVDLTDPDTAKAVATKLFQDMMGRDPGAGELGSFASALHSAEQNSPVVQNTTTQYDMDTGQALSSSTESSGGVSAEGKQYIGEQQVKKKKEYGAFQAATTYQNALESLVFGAPE